MSKITIQENNIFNKWGNLIVKDGVVEEKQFQLAKKKILVILKETNDYVNKSQDLRDFLQEGGRAQTWDNIARWIYGLQNLEESTDDMWEHLSDMNKDKRKRYLSTISSMNLKKKPGGAVTNLSELKAETKSSIGYLKEQIALYTELDYVLCGGRDVANLVEKYQLFGEIEFVHYDDSYVKIAQAGKTVIISYYHPQARGKHEKLFKDLILAVQGYERAKNKFLNSTGQ